MTYEEGVKVKDIVFSLMELKLAEKVLSEEGVSTASIRVYANGYNIGAKPLLMAVRSEIARLEKELESL